MKIITFDPNLDSSEHLVKKLSIKCEEICKSEDTLAENYKATRFVLADQTAITIVENFEDEIIMFASLWQRDFYGSDCARTMNRTWKSPVIRKNKLWKNPFDRKYFHGPEIIAEHVRVAREKNINQLFISREGGAYRYLTAICPVLEKITHLKWVSPKELFLVCEENSLRCWQNIIYTNVLRDEPINLKSSGLTYEEMITKYKYGSKVSS